MLDKESLKEIFHEDAQGNKYSWGRYWKWVRYSALITTAIFVLAVYPNYPSIYLLPVLVLAGVTLFPLILYTQYSLQNFIQKAHDLIDEIKYLNIFPWIRTSFFYLAKAILLFTQASSVIILMIVLPSYIIFIIPFYFGVEKPNHPLEKVSYTTTVQGTIRFHEYDEEKKRIRKEFDQIGDKVAYEFFGSSDDYGIEYILDIDTFQPISEDELTLLKNGDRQDIQFEISKYGPDYEINHATVSDSYFIDFEYGDRGRTFGCDSNAIKGEITCSHLDLDDGDFIIEYTP